MINLIILFCMAFAKKDHAQLCKSVGKREWSEKTCVWISIKANMFLMFNFDTLYPVSMS